MSIRHQFSYWLTAIARTEEEAAKAYQRLVTDNRLAWPEGPLVFSYKTDEYPDPTMVHGEVDPGWGTVEEDTSLPDIMDKVASVLPGVTFQLDMLDEEDKSIATRIRWNGVRITEKYARTIGLDDGWDTPTLEAAAKMLREHGYNAAASLVTGHMPEANPPLEPPKPKALQYRIVHKISPATERLTRAYLSGTKKQDADDIVRESVVFPDGRQMDIKCCGCQDEDETSWTEAVLFDERGCELTCTQPGEDFTGTWTITYDGTEYVVTIATDNSIADDEPAEPDEPETLLTHDVAADIVELFEAILEQHSIRIPSPEDDDGDRPEDDIGLYGTTYDCLLESVETALIDIIEQRDGGARVVIGTFNDMGDPDDELRKPGIAGTVKKHWDDAKKWLDNAKSDEPGDQ